MTARKKDSMCKQRLSASRLSVVTLTAPRTEGSHGQTAPNDRTTVRCAPHRRALVLTSDKKKTFILKKEIRLNAFCLIRTFLKLVLLPFKQEAYT